MKKEHQWKRIPQQPLGLNLIGCENNNCVAIKDWTEFDCPKPSKWKRTLPKETPVSKSEPNLNEIGNIGT